MFVLIVHDLDVSGPPARNRLVKILPLPQSGMVCAALQAKCTMSAVVMLEGAAPNGMRMHMVAKLMYVSNTRSFTTRRGPMQQGGSRGRLPLASPGMASLPSPLS